MVRRKEVEQDDNGNILMTKDTLRVLCELNDLYSFADLNEKLLLQFKGFLQIENLEEYVNVKAIWLNNNALTKIENLTAQTSLVSLFLNNNLIAKIENIDHLQNLQQLNISHNRISKIEGLSMLTRLNSINLSSNIIQDKEGLVGILECQSLTNIDLSSNLIEHDDSIIDLFIQMPLLACLYLKNNPGVRFFKDYRKRLVGFVSTLLFLDDKPVTTDDRRVSEAWIRDGREGETSERQLLIKERDERNAKYFDEMIAMQEEISKKRKIVYKNTKKTLLEEIENIKQVMEVCSDRGQIYMSILTRDLASVEEKLLDLEANKETLSVVEEQQEVKSFSSTINPDGSVSIWNKTDDQVQQIKKQFFDNPTVQRTRTRQELEDERQRKLQEDRLSKLAVDEQENEMKKNNEETEEDERRQREFIDHSSKWKSFMRSDKQTGEESLNEQSQLQEICNPKINITELRTRWIDGDYDRLIEELLLRYEFNFNKAQVEFNKIASQVEKQSNKSSSFIEFSVEELRQMWTYIELNRLRIADNESQQHEASAVFSKYQETLQEEEQRKALSAEAQRVAKEEKRLNEEEIAKAKQEIREIKKQLNLVDTSTVTSNLIIASRPQKKEEIQISKQNKQEEKDVDLDGLD